MCKVPQDTLLHAFLCQWDWVRHIVLFEALLSLCLCFGGPQLMDSRRPPMLSKPSAETSSHETIRGHTEALWPSSEELSMKIDLTNIIELVYVASLRQALGQDGSIMTFQQFGSILKLSVLLWSYWTPFQTFFPIVWNCLGRGDIYYWKPYMRKATEQGEGEQRQLFAPEESKECHDPLYIANQPMLSHLQLSLVCFLSPLLPPHCLLWSLLTGLSNSGLQRPESMRSWDKYPGHTNRHLDARSAAEYWQVSVQVLCHGGLQG